MVGPSSALYGRDTDIRTRAIFRVGTAPDFARTTATYTVIKEKQDFPAAEWDESLQEWVFEAHPPEPSES